MWAHFFRSSSSTHKHNVVTMAHRTLFLTFFVIVFVNLSLKPKIWSIDHHRRLFLVQVLIRMQVCVFTYIEPWKIDMSRWLKCIPLERIKYLMQDNLNICKRLSRAHFISIVCRCTFERNPICWNRNRKNINTQGHPYRSGIYKNRLLFQMDICINFRSFFSTVVLSAFFRPAMNECFDRKNLFIAIRYYDKTHIIQKKKILSVYDYLKITLRIVCLSVCGMRQSKRKKILSMKTWSTTHSTLSHPGVEWIKYLKVSE